MYFSQPDNLFSHTDPYAVYSDHAQLRASLLANKRIIINSPIVPGRSTHRKPPHTRSSPDFIRISDDWVRSNVVLKFSEFRRSTTKLAPISGCAIVENPHWLTFQTICAEEDSLCFSGLARANSSGLGELRPPVRWPRLKSAITPIDDNATASVSLKIDLDVYLSSWISLSIFPWNVPEARSSRLTMIRHSFLRGGYRLGTMGTVVCWGSGWTGYSRICGDRAAWSTFSPCYHFFLTTSVEGSLIVEASGTETITEV